MLTCWHAPPPHFLHPVQEVTTPVGQYAYATPALLESRGLSEADRESTKVSTLL